MALRGTVVVPQEWNQFAIQSFMGLVLLPVAFAFSVRMLPLYLRLPSPTWSVRGIAYAYGVTVMVQLLPTAPALSRLAPQGALVLASLGMMLKGGVILWFVVAARSVDPTPASVDGASETPSRARATSHSARCAGLRRVWSLRTSGVCGLCLARPRRAGGEVVVGSTTLLGHSWVSSTTAIRHIYLLGFMTLLIFGMAVRMLPGFWHKRHVAEPPALVEATFWLGNIAVGCRVLLFLLPAGVWNTVPGSLLGARMAFALSGVLRWGLWCAWQQTCGGLPGRSRSMRDHANVSTVSPSPAALSPWWRHAVILTMIGGFTVLIWLSIQVYHDAPPIPAQVVSPAGDTIFTHADILAGQRLFLQYGLMENGSIWGHGAYLGPDFSAAYLHALALDVGETLATERYNRRLDTLTTVQRDAVDAEVQRLLKHNRYDAQTNTLVLTPPEVASFRHQIAQWAAYFAASTTSAGLPHAYITDLARAPATDGVLCLDRLGVRRQSTGQNLLLHEQFSV